MQRCNSTSFPTEILFLLKPYGKKTGCPPKSPLIPNAHNNLQHKNNFFKSRGLEIKMKAQNPTKLEEVSEKPRP